MECIWEYKIEYILNYNLNYSLNCILNCKLLYNRKYTLNWNKKSNLDYILYYDRKYNRKSNRIWIRKYNILVENIIPETSKLSYKKFKIKLKKCLTMLRLCNILLSEVRHINQRGDYMLYFKD